MALGQLHGGLGVAQSRQRHRFVRLGDQHRAPLLQRLDPHVRSLHLALHLIHLQQGGGLLVGQAAQGRVFFLVVVLFNPKTGQVAFDSRQLELLAARVDGSQIRPRLRHTRFGGVQIRLQTGVAQDGQRSALAYGLSLLHGRLAHQPGLLHAHRLPLDRLHFAVSRECAVQRLPDNFGKRDLRRIAAPVVGPPADSGQWDRQQPQQFLHY